MKWFLLFSGIAVILGLVVEQILATRHRQLIKHVIYVNGTRGKSGVTRLIGATIAESGLRVMVKTTGTLPMLILPSGEEKEIKRHGPANIKEQLWVLRQAVKEQADVLVCECMAVDPELQYISEHKMMHSDIGIITNARVDHVAEMGNTEEEVAMALLNTMPKGGTLITADALVEKMAKTRADKMQTKVVLVDTQRIFIDDMAAAETENMQNSFEFPENINMAMEVAKLLSIDAETALRGMSKVKKDPYTSFAKEISKNVLFVDSFSANDPVSTKKVYEKYTENISVTKKVIILNNRADRGYRTDLMVKFICEEEPKEVWLLGAQKWLVRQRIFVAFSKKDFVPEVRLFKTAEEIPIFDQPEGTALWAIGNIKDEGMKLSDRVKKINAVNCDADCVKAMNAENCVTKDECSVANENKEETECTVK